MPNNQIQSLTISGTTYDIVDNTSGYIIADSPALTGTPTAPTPLSGADDTQIATVKYVQDAMAGAGAGTVTSVGVANATDGGLSVSGSPITSSGTISVGHSNVLASAQTTSGIYPIKIDKNGHISEYGNAVSIPTNTSDLNNDSQFVSQIDLAENLVSTLCYLNVSGSTASLIDANASVVGIFELSSAFRSVKGVQVAQVLNISGDLAEARVYEIVDADTINRTVRLVAVEGSTVYIADLTDAGSGLTGTISTVSIPTVPTNVSAFTNDAGYLTSYTETDPTVPSWAKAASKPTYTASEVGALASNTTYVSKITTTAGAHTAISNKSGAVSFNVPTKTSHLTNDSGYITSDSDEKVKSAAVTAATTYYLIGSTNATTETATTSKHGSVNISVGADSNTSGGSRLTLGNSTAAGTAGAKYGYLRLYGNTTHYVDLQTEASYPTANRTIYLPSYGGTMYLTCTSTTDAVGGATSAPVYVDNTGRIQEIESLELGLVKKPFMRATGSGTRVNLSASTITQVPLTTIEFQGEYSGISLDTTKHTILLEPGYYRISGSIYFASGVTYSSMQGIYIRMDSTSIAFANATEVAASYIYGSISINTRAIVKVVDDFHQSCCHQHTGSLL